MCRLRRERGGLVKRRKAKRTPTKVDTTHREGDGRYTFSDLDRLCRCGHTLGAHGAIGARGCMADECFEPESDVPCDCAKFKPKR